jgi:hypothetical protein
MRKTLAFAAIAFFGLAAPAAAWDMNRDGYDYAPACSAPAAPVRIDAGSRDAVTAFIAASDSYQQCLGRALGARQDTAFFAKTNVSAAAVRQIEGRARASQRQKEAIGKAYNAAVTGGTGTP